MHRPIGLAHLSALDVPPRELITAAAEVGYSSVGVRVHPATASEERYPMTAHSPMSLHTRTALAETGLKVFDVEVFTLDGVRGPDQWMPVLEAGAFLGADVLNVIGGDPQRERLLDTLAHLVRDAAQFDITASIEPISYQHVDTFTDAAAVARQSGCAIMLDVLHFVRAGGTLADLDAAPEGAVRVIQLCDGPPSVPALQAPRTMPLGQNTNGSPRQIESRAKRLVPSTGSFPLVEILRALPGVPISVEVPDVDFVDAHGAHAHLARLFTATSELVASADHETTEISR
ncbi:TIM barrel protein [Rhodococcus fascians]|nr:TIM barrel protein [Rhodococcus fascians]MBY4114576.1 TIM barrel protein [Rhodococcus fascians]